MPDRRMHRGAHPGDAERFAEGALPALRAAAVDLCLLLSRGYTAKASMKLVGDRFRLDQRQRAAVLRTSCSDVALARRLACRVDEREMRGRQLWLDGFNVLTTVEAALGGAAVFAARDACFRDLMGVHGSYRQVAETEPAISLVGAALDVWGVSRCVWLLDSPVSNSGRLRGALAEVARARGWDWEVRLEHSPDRVLRATDRVIGSADGAILDACGSWLNLACAVVTGHVKEAWIVELFP